MRCANCTRIVKELKWICRCALTLLSFHTSTHVQRILKENEDLQKEHEDVKKKLEASKARNKSLSTEIKTLKVQISTLLEKGKHDDELVDALLVRHR